MSIRIDVLLDPGRRQIRLAANLIDRMLSRVDFVASARRIRYANGIFVDASNETVLKTKCHQFPGMNQNNTIVSPSAIRFDLLTYLSSMLLSRGHTHMHSDFKVTPCVIMEYIWRILCRDGGGVVVGGSIATYLLKKHSIFIEKFIDNTELRSTHRHLCASFESIVKFWRFRVHM